MVVVSCSGRLLVSEEFVIDCLMLSLSRHLRLQHVYLLLQRCDVVLLRGHHVYLEQVVIDDAPCQLR